MNANVYYEILKQYDLWNVEDVIPVAHIRIRPDIGILLDNNGNFMGSKLLINERCSIPCTIDSESRTAGVNPHPIHDNMSYVCGNYIEYANRHEAYMKQLENYIEEVDDELAKSIYKYLSKNTIYNDVSSILPEVTVPEDKVMIIFATPNHTDTISKKWTEYYINTLEKNDFCPITGEPDYIPSKYPKGIRSSVDMGKLFLATEKPLNSMSILSPGYITSQKILHTLQFMMYEGDSWAYGILKDNMEYLPDEIQKKVKKYYGMT